MENLRRYFSIFEACGGNIFFDFKFRHSGKIGASKSKEIKIKLVWPQQWTTNIATYYNSKHLLEN
jgi:hypothetical protein